MDRRSIITFISVFVFVLGVGLFSTHDRKVPTEDVPTEEATGSYIVQGASLDAVAIAVHSVHARVTHELGVINAVSADLTATQFERLTELGNLKIVADRSRHGAI